MNETLKKIGQELRRRYQSVLHMPLNWRMIDAITHLEELEESKTGAGTRATQGSDEPPRAECDRDARADCEQQSENNVVDLPQQRSRQS